MAGICHPHPEHCPGGATIRQGPLRPGTLSGPLGYCSRNGGSTDGNAGGHGARDFLQRIRLSDSQGGHPCSSVPEWKNPVGSGEQRHLVLAGCWCDVDQSVAYNTEKGVREETGCRVRAERIIAVRDWRKHSVTNYAYGVVKMFILCKLIDGSFWENIETTGMDFLAGRICQSRWPTKNAPKNRFSCASMPTGTPIGRRDLTEQRYILDVSDSRLAVSKSIVIWRNIENEFSNRANSGNQTTKRWLY